MYSRTEEEAQWQLEIHGHTLYLGPKNFSSEGEPRDKSCHPHLVAECIGLGNNF